jgi:hypothetical protein
MTELAQQPAIVTECVERARELMRLTAEVLGVEEICPMSCGADLHAVDAALSVARQYLTRHRELAALSPQRQPDHVVAALMLRLELTQLSVPVGLLHADPPTELVSLTKNDPVRWLALAVASGLFQ